MYMYASYRHQCCNEYIPISYRGVAVGDDAAKAARATGFLDAADAVEELTVTDEGVDRKSYINGQMMQEFNTKFGETVEKQTIIGTSMVCIYRHIYICIPYYMCFFCIMSRCICISPSPKEVYVIQIRGPGYRAGYRTTRNKIFII